MIESLYRRVFKIVKSSGAICAGNARWGIDIDIEIAIGIGIEQRRNANALGHERLDVYRLAIGYVAWVYGNELDRMAAMLSRLGGRGYQVREDPLLFPRSLYEIPVTGGGFPGLAVCRHRTLEESGVYVRQTASILRVLRAFVVKIVSLRPTN
jgi:hypothetical protein